MGLQDSIDDVLALFMVVIFHKGIISFSLGLNMVQSKLSLYQVCSYDFMCLSFLELVFMSTGGETKPFHGIKLIYMPRYDSMPYVMRMLCNLFSIFILEPEEKELRSEMFSRNISVH